MGYRGGKKDHPGGLGRFNPVSLEVMNMTPWAEDTYREARRAGRCEKCVYSMVCLTTGYVAKIPAVKHHRRENPGTSLKEAKDYVEDKMLCQDVVP